MGTFKQSCPHCGTRIEVDDIYAGRKANCPRCGKVFELKPEPAQPPKAPQNPDNGNQRHTPPPRMPQNPDNGNQGHTPPPGAPQNPFNGNQGYIPPQMPQNPFNGNQGYIPPQMQQNPFNGNQGYIPPQMQQNPFNGNQGYIPPQMQQNPYNGNHGYTPPPGAPQKNSPSLAELTVRFGGNIVLAVLVFILRWIWDFLMFRRMIYRLWVILLSTLETLFGVGLAVFFFVKHENLYGSITIAVVVLLRIFWEWLAVFFAINDTLTTLKNSLGSGKR